MAVAAAAAWPLCTLQVDSVHRYQELAVLLFGVMSAGAATVEQAALDDLFAKRPVLRASIEAKSSVLSSACGLVAPLVGAVIAAQSHAAALCLSASITMLQLPVLAMSRETLGKQARKPFKLAKADPMKNLGILFNQDVTLRRLTLSSICTTSGNGVHRTMQSYQIGSLGWNPSNQTYYSSFQSALSMISQSCLIVPMLRKFGSKRAYEISGHFATTSLLLISQAHRGGTVLRRSVQFLLAMVAMLPAHVAPVASRSMLVSHGLAKTAAGPGELNAAIQGVASLVNVVLPLLWARVHYFFETTGVGSWWHSPGGAFLVAAVIRAVAVQISVHSGDRTEGGVPGGR
eukprot:SAG31_NODE_8557_length_1431_cov_0.783033_1_plen_345_part_00